MINKLKSGIMALAVAGLAAAVYATGLAPANATLKRSNPEGTPGYVPGKVTNVSYNFDNGVTTGTFTFTMPTELYYAPAPAVGWTKYRIAEANTFPEVVYAEDYADFGETVTVPVTLTAGYHTLIVFAVNEKGKSNAHTGYPYLQLWVGPGEPSKVTDITLSRDGNNVSLSWAPVTSSTRNDAYFDPANVTYTVVRTPDDVVVSQSQSSTTFSEPVPTADGVKGYRYKITAEFMGLTSTPAYSPGFAAGNAVAPWSTDFSSINDFLTFTASPADNYSWQYDETSHRAKLVYDTYNSVPGNDDWLISPPIMLQQGMLYPVSYLVSSYSDRYTQTVEIKAGTTPTPAGMTFDVVGDTEVKTSNNSRENAADVKGFFLAPTTGLYYIGLHDKTPAKVYDSYCYGFSIGEGVLDGAPDVVTNLSATSDFDVTPPTAVISFNAPTQSIAGSPLALISDISIYRGEEKVKSFANPRPGETLSYTDVLADDAKGEYTYKIVASNSAGIGRPLETTLFVGDYRIHPPYTNTFETNPFKEGYISIDSDNQGGSYEWQYDASAKMLTCNTTSAAPSDDWLILPAIWLNAGYRYVFSTEVKSYWQEDPVPFEVYMGKAPAIESLTNMLGELKDDKSYIGKEFTTLNFNADPSESGEYYFAIRYVGEGNSCKLCLNQISVAAGLDVADPKEITDLVATADFGGECKVNLTFTAPSLTMAGNPLTKISKIEIMRDGQLIKTIANPAPGTPQSFEDSGMEQGYHTYSVTPWGSSRGETSQTTVYVGANIPNEPMDALMIEDLSKPGTVTLSWLTPEYDVDGNPVNPALVKYNIYALSIFGEEPQLLMEGVEGNKVVFQAVPEGEQHFVWYRVKAVTAGGESAYGSDTEAVAVGKPYSLPFADSFADGTLSYEFDSERIGEYPAQWIVYSDRDFTNLIPQDFDNGVIGMYAPYTIGKSRLVTGKIDLADVDNPVVSIWFRAVKDSQSTVAIEVRDCNDSRYRFTQLVEKPFWGDNYPQDWVKVDASLADFKGKTVQIGITGNAASQNYLFFDNLRIEQQYQHNLTALDITAPARMYPSEQSEIKMRLQNNGAQSVDGGSYTVDLYRNGEKVQSIIGDVLMPDEISEVTFKEVPTVALPTDLKYHVEIAFSKDNAPADNVSDEVSISLRIPEYPVVKDLTGSSANGLNSLKWSEPTFPASNKPGSVTESFESFGAFAKSDLDDWKLVDADGENFGGFGEMILPGIYGPIPYFVMDSESEMLPYDPDGTLKAHTGDKYLVSGWVEGSTGVNDDWLISPLLSQTSDYMSLWARSYDPSLLETFEVLYSTTDRNPENFKRIRLTGNVPAEWTKYEFTIPTGAKYFAIRCISNDKFMFFLDDITYTPASPTEPMTILGYNIYRDHEKVNASPVAETKYDDNMPDTGRECKYTVSTVYDLGESGLSNEVAIISSLVDSVYGQGINIETGANCVIITGAEGLEANLYDLDGRLLNSTICADPQRMDVVSGVCILTVGPNRYKLMIK